MEFRRRSTLNNSVYGPFQARQSEFSSSRFSTPAGQPRKSHVGNSSLRKWAEPESGHRAEKRLPRLTSYLAWVRTKCPAWSHWDVQSICNGDIALAAFFDLCSVLKNLLSLGKILIKEKLVNSDSIFTEYMHIRIMCNYIIPWQSNG